MRKIRTRVLIAIIIAIIILASFYSLRYIRQAHTNEISTHEGFVIKDGAWRYAPNIKVRVGCLNVLLATYDTLTNEEGFRGRNRDINTSEDVIGVFGDSFIWGECLDDTQTLDYLLEKELNKRGRNYSVFNFGMPGYNLNSSLIVLDDISRRYHLRYAIVNFFADDDMLECDSSCGWTMAREDPEGYKKFAKNISDYITDRHLNSEKLILNNFENLIKGRVIEKGITKRTELVFYMKHYYVNHTEVMGDVVREVLDRYGVKNIFREPFEECEGIEKPCQILGDGHPSALFNELAAKQLADYIVGLEE